MQTVVKGIPQELQTSGPGDMAEEVSIDWTKYVDHIYLIHYTGRKTRMEYLKPELDRLGISGSGILRTWYNFPTRYTAVLEEHCGYKRKHAVDIAHATLRILREAVELGYSRIMIIEDDIRVVRDLSLVRRSMESAPYGDSIMQLDWWPMGEMEHCISVPEGWDRHPEASKLWKPLTCNHCAGGGMYIVSGKAMVELADILEDRLIAPDRAMSRLDSGRFITSERLAAQLPFIGESDHLDDNGSFSAARGVSYSVYNMPESFMPNFGVMVPRDDLSNGELSRMMMDAWYKYDDRVSALWFCVQRLRRTPEDNVWINNFRLVMNSVRDRLHTGTLGPDDFPPSMEVPKSDSSSSPATLESVADASHSTEYDVFYAIDGDVDQARLIITSVFSLIRSSRDPSIYRVRVLTDHGGRSTLYADCSSRLEALAKSGGLKGLDFIDCGDWFASKFSKLSSRQGFNKANWFRFYAPFISDSERCLYLDNDTVVLNDLSELFSTDMDGAWLGVSENAYVSANSDIRNDFVVHGISCPGGRLRHFPQAGVMLIDAVKARRSGFLDRMSADAYFESGGSDGACYNEPLMYRCLRPDEIHWLPKKYNREANVWLTPEERKSGWQPFDSIADAVIVHMNGGRHKSGECAAYVRRLWDDYERFMSGGAGKPVRQATGPIDWSKYVDAVYLIHFTGDSHKERLPNILSELGRVGISKSDVRIRYTANSRWHDTAAEKCIAEHPGWSMPGWWADVGFATFDILVEALATGLDSIAVFETDCVFVKDTDLLKRYLDTIPENAGIAKLEWFDVGGDVAQVATAAQGESARYWEPRSARTSGAACYIIRRKGMEELLRVLRDFCPGPSDFAMNFCKTDIYVSKGHAAIQRAYPSSKTGGCNAYGKMDLSPYELPEGYDHSIGRCARDSGSGSTLPTPASTSVDLPSFPVGNDSIVSTLRALSSLMKSHPGYREPSCLLARLIHESSPGSDSIVRLLLEQGLRVNDRKPGLPVDEWCWSGGPERLLSSLGPQATLPDGSVPLVL